MIHALLVCAVGLGSPFAAQETFPEVGLTLTFPDAFTGLQPLLSRDESQIGGWRGSLGAKRVSVQLHRTERRADSEPSDLTENVLFNVRNADVQGPAYEILDSRLVPGPYGHAPYASLIAARIQNAGRTDDAASVWYFAGLAETAGWYVYVVVEPPASPAEEQQVVAFLTEGIAYEGPVRVAEWTEEQVETRWAEWVPASTTEKAQRLEKVVRTDHYLILTNSSSGKTFAKQMEKNYDVIRSIFPFDEVPGRKLMPVFLFQLPSEYHAFCVANIGWDLESARKSKGVASRDFYATYYESPKDPVHIHEATHQIFGNRLMLNGGGSWFQEGVAEYVETKPNDRNDIARLVKKGEHTPLREFFGLRSLLYSSEDGLSGRSAAGDNYKQAALFIEFMRESKFGKERFDAWLHAMGYVPRGSLAAIEEVFARFYDVDIPALEEAFVAWAKKR